MGAARAGDYRHAVSVELDEDEFVPYRGYILLRGMAWGELFLTTKRLIWIRSTIFALPFGPKLVVVPLSDIEGWSIEPVPWWWFDWWRKRRAIRVRTASGTYNFVTAWTREDADEWAKALDNVMTGAGLAQRGARK